MSFVHDTRDVHTIQPFDENSRETLPERGRTWKLVNAHRIFVGTRHSASSSNRSQIGARTEKIRENRIAVIDLPYAEVRFDGIGSIKKSGLNSKNPIQ